MKARFFVPIAMVMAGVLFSCYMPQAPNSREGPGIDQESNVGLAIETDYLSNQGIFVNEKGLRIKIESVEADGTLVKCAKALDLAVPKPDFGSPLSDNPVKAVVIGMRGDGKPGAWLVLKDDSIGSLFNEEGSGRTSELPECWDRDQGLRGRFGWTYYLTGISEDGKIIIGYAKNEKGINHGRFQIEPGTTVGVYWKVVVKPGFPHYLISRARVIGVIDPPQPPPTEDRWKKMKRHMFYRALEHLKLFFLSYLESYLTMTYRVFYRESEQVYVVYGLDQDGREAHAFIDRFDKIRIEVVEQPGGDLPDLTVLSIQVPELPQQKDATWPLGATIANSGQAAAGPFTVEYFRSTDASLDGSDTLLRSISVPQLAAGASYSDDSGATTYSISEPGTHYIIVAVDRGGGLEESDETNNTSFATVTIFSDIIYNSLIIDTYRPDPTFGLVYTKTQVALYRQVSETTAELIAEADSGNETYPDYARLTYTDGLTSGIYYIRINVEPATTGTGPYAVRVVTAIDSWPNEYPAAESWYFDEFNYDDSSYEGDDAVSAGGIPLKINPIAIGEKHNRYLGSPNDVDWFRLVLP